MRPYISGLLLTAVLVMLSGCGGSSSATIQPGNWKISLTQTGTAASGFLGGNLTQSGSTISGTMLMNGGNGCITTEDVQVSGTVKGQNITLTTAPISNVVITMNLTGSGATLSGTYSYSGCAITDNGTVNASLVPPITGTWHGVLTSSINPAKSLDITEVLTQGSTPNVHGELPLTGTVTFGGSTCFTAGTISTGVIEATEVGTTITTNDTPNPGRVFVTFNLPGSTPSTLNAEYQIQLGACSFDQGFGTFTKQ